MVALLLAAVSPTRAQRLDDFRLKGIRPMDTDASMVILVRALGESRDPEIHASLLKGILTGLEGQRNVPAPEGWNTLGERLGQSSSKDVREKDWLFIEGAVGELLLRGSRNPAGKVSDQLYHLAQDPTEDLNVFDYYPEVRRRLQQKLSNERSKR